MSRAAGVKAGQRPELVLPEPDRLWIRYAPRSWPCAPAGGERDSGAPPLWLDLAGDRLGVPGEPGAEEIDLPTGPFDDVLYLPPVAAELRTARDRAAAEVAGQGTPVLVQLLPGESPTQAEGVVAVYDLLEPLVAGDLAALSELPRATAALWPLVAGLSDSADLREEGVRRLAEAGVAVLQAVSPDLPPADRRRLFESQSEIGRDEERDAELFQQLFHGDLPDPRPLARAARAQGLAPFLSRPLPRPPLIGAAKREVAGLLGLAGELHLRLGQETRSQACFRAARWTEQTPLDLRALARESNLHVLPWLDSTCRSIIEEWASTGRSATVESLSDLYLS